MKSQMRVQRFFLSYSEAQKELYPGCKEATKVSFIIRIYQMKCMHGFSNSGIQSILDLFALFHPKIPDTLDKVCKVVRDLGLDYQKIHACVNDCVLFRGDYADWIHVQPMVSLGGKGPILLKMLSPLALVADKSIFHVRSCAISHLLLGCKDCL